MVDESPETEDYPSRIVDVIEGIATKIRSLTVDKVARVITFITLGLVALTLVGFAVAFFLIGVFRILGELVRKACDCGASMEITYAIFGGLFLALGALLWSRRVRPPAADVEEDDD